MDERWSLHSGRQSGLDRSLNPRSSIHIPTSSERTPPRPGSPYPGRGPSIAFDDFPEEFYFERTVEDQNIPINNDPVSKLLRIQIFNASGYFRLIDKARRRAGKIRVADFGPNSQKDLLPMQQQLQFNQTLLEKPVPTRPQSASQYRGDPARQSVPVRSRYVTGSKVERTSLPAVPLERPPLQTKKEAPKPRWR